MTLTLQSKAKLIQIIKALRKSKTANFSKVHVEATLKRTDIQGFNTRLELLNPNLHYSMRKKSFRFKFKT